MDTQNAFENKIQCNFPSYLYLLKIIFVMKLIINATLAVKKILNTLTVLYN